MTAPLKAPFPEFGGKSRAAPIVWRAFGDVANYVEPFAGSLAVLLARPTPPRIETVNDLDCYLANFWRAVQMAPEEVARWADWPVNEADLHARHLWLVNQAEFRERMKTDPEYFDVKIAGWWVWGLCQWIGSGWCSRSTPSNQLPNLRGLDGAAGQGIHASALTRKLPLLGGGSKGVHSRGLAVHEWMSALATRLRDVRVACGDWSRVLGPSTTHLIGTTAILLDPPYAEGCGGMYTNHDKSLSAQVREWAIENGGNPQLRIALCGYEGEHAMPADWQSVAWKANGGYGAQRRDGSNQNAHRERIWFSPHCLPVEELQPSLFDRRSA